MDFYIIYDACSFSFGRKIRTLVGFGRWAFMLCVCLWVQNRKIEYGHGYKTVSILTRYIHFRYNSGKRQRANRNSTVKPLFFLTNHQELSGRIVLTLEPWRKQESCIWKVMCFIFCSVLFDLPTLYFSLYVWLTFQFQVHLVCVHWNFCSSSKLCSSFAHCSFAKFVFNVRNFFLLSRLFCH